MTRTRKLKRKDKLEIIKSQCPILFTDVTTYKVNGEVELEICCTECDNIDFEFRAKKHVHACTKCGTEYTSQ